jgi:uncharacterized Zn-binding protein involved in type VI secretion
MAIGYFLRVGDKTTCGGQILTGDNTFIFHGRSAARQGDLVTCGKHSGTYNILGGVSNVWGNGRMMAGTLDSFSSCPCKARLINSITDCYSKDDEPAQARSFVEIEQKQLITTPKPSSTVNNVFNNTHNVPVITSNSPINKAFIKDPINIYVMIAIDWEGHIGLIIGDGEDAILYDPGGSYTGCYNRRCEDGAPTHRGSNDQFPYPMWEWNDYLFYHLASGPNVSIVQFTIPKKQADHLIQIIDEMGGVFPGFCAAKISEALRASGGIFSKLPTVAYMRWPSTFKSELMDLYFPSREWWKLNGAY